MTSVALLLLALAGLTTAGVLAMTSTHKPASRTAASPATAAATRSSALAACRIPAPTTAAGYAAMFARIDPALWGAADVSLSLPLGDGRTLWLYGDTLRAGPWVHSSAIVQTGGCLHVVNGGAQLLPNVDRQHIYWIQSATLDPTLGVVVQARAITLTGTGPWDFRDGGHSQRFAFALNSTGDVAAGVPARSIGRPLPSPAPHAGPMYVYGPHHFGYERRVHQGIRLADGRYLVTTCQNWDDRVLHQFADYRPVFSEAALARPAAAPKGGRPTS